MFSQQGDPAVCLYCFIAFLSHNYQRGWIGMALRLYFSPLFGTSLRLVRDFLLLLLSPRVFCNVLSYQLQRHSFTLFIGNDT